MKKIYLKFKRWQLLSLLFFMGAVLQSTAQISGPFNEDVIEIFNTAIGDVIWGSDDPYVTDNYSIEDAEFDNGSNDYGDAYDGALEIYYDYDDDVDMEFKYHFSETYGAVIVEVIVTNDNDEDYFYVGDSGNLGSDESTYWHYLNTDGPFYAIASDQSGSNDEGGDPVVSFIWGDETMLDLGTIGEIHYTFDESDDNYSIDWFDFTIQPNETQRFLFIGGLGNIDDDNGNTPADAYDAVQLLLNPANWPADFTSFLTDEEKATVVNWDLSGLTILGECTPDIVTNAEPGLCAKYINFDGPTHYLGSDVTTTYTLSGATTRTIISTPYVDNSQANFNVGTTRVDVLVEQNTEPFETFQCHFNVEVIDRTASWALYWNSGGSDPHFYLGSDGEITIHPADFLDLTQTFDNYEKCPGSLDLYFVNQSTGTRYSSLYFDCANVQTTHYYYDIVSVDQNGWEEWLSNAAIYINNTSPVAECTSTTLYLNGSGVVSLYPDDIDNGSWDDCGITSRISVEGSGYGSSYPFDCDNAGGTYDVTLWVEDTYGVDDYCYTTVTILDDIDPVISSVPNTTLYLNSGGSASLSSSSYSAYVSDNCDVDELWLSDTSWDCEDLGDHTVTLYADDYSNNQSSKNFTVTIADTIKPVVVCQDVTIYLDEDGEAGIVAEGGLIGSSLKSAAAVLNDVITTVYDNCDYKIELSQDSFDCGDVCLWPVIPPMVVGNLKSAMPEYPCNLVTVTVTDSAGNVATCYSQVSVLDTISPTAICKPVTVYLDDNGMATLDSLALNNSSFDNCEIDSFGLDIDTFYCASVGANLVTMTVRDEHGNTSTCQNYVTVSDTTSPTVLCKDTTLYLDASGDASLVSEDIDNGSTDNCSIASMTLDVYDFDCEDVGSNTVTLTVTDVNSNSNYCTATVTVLDTLKPEVLTTTTDTILYLDENGLASLSADDIDGGSNDNCSVASVSLSKTQFDCNDVGTSIYTLGYNWNYDLAEFEFSLVGNTFELQEMFEFDNEEAINHAIDRNPVTGKVYLEISDGEDSRELYQVNELTGELNYVGDLVSSDGNEYAQDFAFGSDGYLYVAYKNGTIDKLDVETMNASAHANVGNHGAVGITYDFDEDRLIMAYNDDPYDVIEILNNGTVNYLFTVNETEGITGQLIANAIEYIGSGKCMVSGHWTNEVYTLDLGTGDISNIISLADAQSEIDEFSMKDMFYDWSHGAGTQTTLTVTDASGNSDNAVINVTVLDTLVPTAVCHNTNLYADIDGNTFVDPAELDNGSSDNCSFILTTSVDTFGPEYLGTSQLVTLYIIDASGNQSSCTSLVSIKDTVDPVAICANNLFFNDLGEVDGVINMDPLTINNESWDISGIKEYSLDKSVFTCDDLGENLVTLTVVDSFNNSSSCTAVVLITDLEVPVLQQVEDMEVELGAGTCETTVDYPEIIADDVCDLTYTLISGLGSDGVYPLGTSVETWVATDLSGNADTMSFTIIVTGEASTPAINAIADVTVENDEESVEVALSGIYNVACSVDALTVTAATDDTEIISSLTVDYENLATTGLLTIDLVPGVLGSATITVTVENNNGGMTEESFMLTVVPVNLAPTLTNPVADQSVEAENTLEIVVSSASGEYFSDAEDATLTISAKLAGGTALPDWATLVGDTLVFTPAIADTGCVNIVVTATDAGGLSATDTFEVCVDYTVGFDFYTQNSLTVNMYPNPTRGNVTIDLSKISNDAEIWVMDIAGRKVINQTFKATNQILLDLSKEVSGMYFVRINLDGELINKKLILKK